MKREGADVVRLLRHLWARKIVPVALGWIGKKLAEIKNMGEGEERATPGGEDAVAEEREERARQAPEREVELPALRPEPVQGPGGAEDPGDALHAGQEAEELDCELIGKPEAIIPGEMPIPRESEGIDLQLKGSLASDDSVLVYTEDEVLKEIMSEAQKESSLTGFETGGLLIGDPHKDGERLWVQVSAMEVGTSMEKARTSLKFTMDTWSRFHELVDGKYSGKAMVGWWHSHPGYGIFLSQNDLSVCDAFREPWQVALVVDPTVHPDRIDSSNAGFFCRKQGAMLPCNGFYTVWHFFTVLLQDGMKFQCSLKSRPLRKLIGKIVTKAGLARSEPQSEKIVAYWLEDRRTGRPLPPEVDPVAAGIKSGDSLELKSDKEE